MGVGVGLGLQKRSLGYFFVLFHFLSSLTLWDSHDQILHLDPTLVPPTCKNPSQHLVPPCHDLT